MVRCGGGRTPLPVRQRGRPRDQRPCVRGPLRGRHRCHRLVLADRRAVADCEVLPLPPRRGPATPVECQRLELPCRRWRRTARAAVGRSVGRPTRRPKRTARPSSAVAARDGALAPRVMRRRRCGAPLAAVLAVACSETVAEHVLGRVIAVSDGALYQPSHSGLVGSARMHQCAPTSTTTEPTSALPVLAPGTTPSGRKTDRG